MKCYECGGTYSEVSALLEINDPFVGPIYIPNAHYYQCDKCKGTLYPVETAKAIDKARTKRLLELLRKKPVEDYVSAAEAADMLGVTRQAFNKNRRIRHGFIFQTTMSRTTVYLRDSVALFLKTGDGRFPLRKDSESLTADYRQVPIPRPLVAAYHSPRSVSQPVLQSFGPVCQARVTESAYAK